MVSDCARHPHAKFHLWLVGNTKLCNTQLTLCCLAKACGTLLPDWRLFERWSTSDPVSCPEPSPWRSPTRRGRRESPRRSSWGTGTRHELGKNCTAPRSTCRPRTGTSGTCSKHFNYFEALFLCTHTFLVPKGKQMFSLSDSLPCFDKCNELSQIFSRTKWTCVSTRSSSVVF